MPDTDAEVRQDVKPDTAPDAVQDQEAPSSSAEQNAIAPMKPGVRLVAQSARPPASAFFTSAKWTADGTTVITSASDQAVRAFVLPDDLLEGASDEPRTLEHQGFTRLPEPPLTVTPAPFFHLGDPATQSFLATFRDHPIQLYHVFPHEDAHAAPLASYKLIRTETEEYIAPSSLLWQAPGSHFLCGSTNRLDLFDASGHASNAPLVTVPTIPSKRYISKGGGVGMKGVVSALDAAPPSADGGSIIAAGTWTRWIGLYDLIRSEKQVANWSVAKAVDSLSDEDLGGSGVAQTIWSPCGRYLVVNERNSCGLLVYDIRVTGQLLSVLRGRPADTHQRMHCDVYAGKDGGFEVWAGAQDGVVRVWEDVGLHGDLATDSSWDWKAHDAPIGSTALHSSGSVVATCSGAWEHTRFYDSNEDKDCSESESESESSEPASTDLGTDFRGPTVLEDSCLSLWSIEAAQN